MTAAASTATEEPAPPARERRRRYLLDRPGFLAPFMLLPSVVYIVALVAIPFFVAIAYSLSDVTVGDPSYDYVGLRNYRTVLEDATFRRAVTNTIFMTVVAMGLVLVLAKVLALVLIRDFKGKWVVRFLVLLPWTTPASLATIAWLWLLDSLFSPIDWVLRELGLLEGNLHWLGNSELAMSSVIAVQTWRIVPLAAVIIMAGLAAIPDEINDAAKVDGAGFWRTLLEVTIPLTLPIMAVATLFGAIVIFTDMAVVYVLTRGGPVDATQVLASWAFFRGIQGGDLAQGAAIALFLFPVLVAFAVLILRSAKRMEVM
ncbi:MAG TPA: sugar ABC transporter permease [Acidimicrobiales bacterium]|nr:sugar ABC transporter permease [Acidimicrobiales bacterium]